VKIVIEEYKHKPRMYKGKDMTKDMFFFPAIPWKWTLYNGSKVVKFGYTHTEEDANRAANQALKGHR
jgi:hypothetical protein